MYPNTFFEIIDNSFIPSIPEKTIAYPWDLVVKKVQKT